ncbi:L-lactate permease [Alphaproteobacteria bacterium]|nr:L-lactate permease [Alphaproteobacteria bacterium]
MGGWLQNYDPLHSLYASALVAMIPIIFFFAALTVLRLKGQIAATISVGLAFCVAVFFYKMPVSPAILTVIYGFCYGLWSIAWIVITALFLYKLAVKTGQFEIIRASVISITDDQRLQVLMIAFSFGAFLEGAAGFGAPVAITAALLVGLGFKPLYAAGLCLIANSAPVAFAAIGVPVIVAGDVSRISSHVVGQMAAYQLMLFAIVVPFLIILVMDRWKGVRETWPAILVVGGSFAVTMFLTATFLGPQLPGVASGLVSLIALMLFLRFWRPKHVFRSAETASEAADAPAYSAGQIFKAWSPFLILMICVALWSLPAFKEFVLHPERTTFWIAVPGLNEMIVKTAPIVGADSPVSVIFKLDLASATSTAILFASMISMIVLKVSPARGAEIFWENLKELSRPVFTIGMVLAFAFVANFSGLSSTLALVLAGTGGAFPFFSPLLGWLGVFLTGSDTSANALFCGLQATTAQQVGVSELLMVAANSTGGVTAKMISPQSIAVACAAVGLIGKESDLFRFTVRYSIIFAVMACLLTGFQQYVTPWMIPELIRLPG